MCTHGGAQVAVLTAAAAAKKKRQSPPVEPPGWPTWLPEGVTAEEATALFDSDPALWLLHGDWMAAPADSARARDLAELLRGLIVRLVEPSRIVRTASAVVPGGESFGAMRERHRVDRLAGQAGSRMLSGVRARPGLDPGVRAELALLRLRRECPELVAEFGRGALLAAGMWPRPDGCRWCHLSTVDLRRLGWGRGRRLLGKPCKACSGRLVVSMLGERSSRGAAVADPALAEDVRVMGLLADSMERQGRVDVAGRLRRRAARWVAEGEQAAGAGGGRG